MLVDPGSKINVAGRNTVNRMAATASQAGYNTQYVQRQNLLNVNGVGKGSAPCKEKAIIPVAVIYDDTGAHTDEYHTNIADGCGENLPAILGLSSMEKKDAVLILREGKQFIAFPGPGGYKIEWSPGTKLLPITKAPSGHLVIPCDKFDKAKNKPEDNLTFVTDYTNHMAIDTKKTTPASTSSSSTLPTPPPPAPHPETPM